MDGGPPLQSWSPRAGADEQIDRALLKYASPDPALHILAIASLQNDRFDALQVQEVREHQPRWSSPDNSDLRVHLRLVQVSAAVAHNHLPGNDLGVVARHKCDQGRQVLGSHAPLDRLVSHYAVESFLG